MSKKRKLPSNMYKKGQCVPRWLVRVERKKLQHRLKFGCDVELIGNCVLMLNEGSCFYIDNTKGVKVCIDGVTVDDSIIGSNTNIFIKIGGAGND
mgnify:FL=1